MALIVQKYGGTSVNTAARREKVLQRIIETKEKGNDVVVVLSAMGRCGDPYATDTLLNLLYQVGPLPQGKIKDLLSSCGEIITVSIMAHALQERGYSAVPLTGFQAGIITDNNFTNADIKDINPDRIKKGLMEGNIIVVAGFQGCTEDMEITTLGRGGSDTTAIALGGILGADKIEIYTDVPGVAFLDPKLVPESPYIKNIDFASMYTLARAGAKVVHPRAVRTAMLFQCPFVIRSVFSDHDGTIVGNEGENFSGIHGIALLRGVSIIKSTGHFAASYLKELAIDELFVQGDKDGCCVAVQGEKSLPPEIGNCEISEECSLITVVWNSTSSMTAENINLLLKRKGIATAGSFKIGFGGTWAVPSLYTLDTIELLLDYLNIKKEIAV